MNRSREAGAGKAAAGEEVANDATAGAANTGRPSAGEASAGDAPAGQTFAGATRTGGAFMGEAFAIVKSAAFAGEARLGKEAIEVVLSGTADGPANAPLDAFLESVHREGRQREIREIRVDLGAVEFMSSSSLKALVSWIGALQDLPAVDRYKIRFRMNPDARWQRRSLHALSMFGGDLVVIDPQ